MSDLHTARNLDVDHDEGRTLEAPPGAALLGSAVSVNALYSCTTGLGIALSAPWTSSVVGVPAPVLLVLGLGLVAFGLGLVAGLAQPGRLGTVGRWAVVADLAWVAGVIALLVARPALVSSVGRTVLVAVSVPVAVVAVAQAVGVARLRTRPATAVSHVRFEAERILPAPSDMVWDAVADAGEYARFADGIATTTILAGSGAGMVRRCTDEHGGAWVETCTLWEDHHRYRMSVDTQSYPWYYRTLIDALEQTWTVEQAGRGTRLSLAFDAQMKLGIIGRVAAAVMGRRQRLQRILRGYDEALSSAMQARST